MNRVLISAAHKSSGKTTLSIGLCAALTEKGINVQPFKKGPDYIDPLWLSAASGRPCYNLDFNTMHHQEILHTVNHQSRGADFQLIEANKGLYDGVALDGSDSNAAMAHLLESPVILVINAMGTTRGVAPLLLGYQAFDPTIQFAGVIFNVVSGSRHEQKLRQVTEKYTDIPVLGAVQRHTELQIEERHLGLMPSNEASAAHQQIKAITEQIQQQVDLPRLIELTQPATQLDSGSFVPFIPTINSPTVKIGICQDPSFGFYYPDDLQALQTAGAEIIAINTLKDTNLPEIDGLFIGGGFPETHLQALHNNQSLRSDIHNAIENGLPTYAECGGLMYLSEKIIWEQQAFPMVGIIPGDAVMYKKPQGRGYIELQETDNMLWRVSGGDATYSSDRPVIKAHEFHYSRLENLKQKGCYAYRVLRGHGITGEHDGWCYKNLLASYAHMRDTDQYHWANRFVDFVRKEKTHG